MWYTIYSENSLQISSCFHSFERQPEKIIILQEVVIMNTTQVCPRTDYLNHIRWFIANRVLINKPTPISHECTNSMIESILTVNWNSTYVENYNGGIHIHITRETYKEILNALFVSDEQYMSFFISFDLAVKMLTNTTNWPRFRIITPNSQ